MAAYISYHPQLIEVEVHVVPLDQCFQLACYATKIAVKNLPTLAMIIKVQSLAINGCMRWYKGHPLRHCQQSIYIHIVVTE